VIKSDITNVLSEDYHQWNKASNIKIEIYQQPLAEFKLGNKA
jgi:hypothetical protein